VAIYTRKEQSYIDAVLATHADCKESREIEEGIWLLVDEVRQVKINYELNQFKFMPSNEELNLFSVIIAITNLPFISTTKCEMKFSS
jgi:hypothetical protein